MKSVELGALVKFVRMPGVGSTEGFSMVVDWLEGPGKGSTKFGKGSTKWGARWGGLMQGWASWKIRNSSSSILNPESVPICIWSWSVTPDNLLYSQNEGHYNRQTNR